MLETIIKNKFMMLIFKFQIFYHFSLPFFLKFLHFRKFYP